MKETISDFFIQCLYDWGIRRIYGFPGDGINGITGAFNLFSHGPHILKEQDVVRFTY